MNRYLTRYPGLPGLIYVALIGALLLTTGFVLLDIAERISARDKAADILARLRVHGPIVSPESKGFMGPRPSGSPFLEGQSITLASAALLQKITSSITGVGGNVISSEIELHGVQPKGGYLKVVANFELEVSALQRLLYQIEAGMPFLFVDQLSVNALPLANDEGRVRVLLGVSGLWQGQK